MAWIYNRGRGRKIFLNFKFIFFENLEIFILKWPKTEEILIFWGVWSGYDFFWWVTNQVGPPPFQNPPHGPEYCDNVYFTPYQYLFVVLLLGI